MKKMRLISGSLLIGALAITGCTQPKQVSRVAVEEQIDLSGNWNDVDSKMVSETMIRDVLNRPWLSNHRNDNGNNPTVIVGRIRNLSSEHIEVKTFVKDMERELINSGAVKFVADSKERKEIRNERLEQQQFASEESAKSLGQETGADFMLQGSITSIIDQANGQKVKYYKINLELINIESNEKVWIGDQEIKKLISQSKTKW